jgi:hypothetical protein
MQNDAGESDDVVKKCRFKTSIEYIKFPTDMANQVQ